MARGLSRVLVAGMATSLACAWLSAHPLATRAAGSISLTTIGTAYTQDFNTLATLGITNALTIPGWDLTETGGSSRDNELYGADNGASSTGDTYSYGTFAALGDRALGGLRTDTLVPVFGASFTNSTGATIGKLDVAYTGEMYRAGVLNRDAADRLDFQLSTDATSLTTGTWVDADALDFSSPNVNTTVGAKDGNASAFRTPLASQINGLAIANGASFWIRWNDFDVAGADDGLAIDDFSITPGVDDEAPHVSASTPADGATNVPVDANVSVTFSEPVTVADGWFDITCTASGTHAAAVSGGPTTWTLNPDADFVGLELCTVTIDGGSVHDTDADDPPDVMAGDATFTFQVVATNTPPTVSNVAGNSCLPGDSGGTFLVDVSDAETAPGDLTLALTGNSNPTLVPNGNVVISGGATRTLSITAASRKSGSGVLTFTLSDDDFDVSFDINVRIGTNGSDTLLGTDGSDLLVGGNGADRLWGLEGADVLCGGNGADLLVGGGGNDFLDGGNGPDPQAGQARHDPHAVALRVVCVHRRPGPGWAHGLPRGSERFFRR